MKKLSTNAKIGIAVGVTAVASLIVAKALSASADKKQSEPELKGKGLSFLHPNLEAIDALVDALVADPDMTKGTLDAYANEFELYGFEDRASRLRQKALTAPKHSKHEIESGAADLWEWQSKQPV